MKINREFKIGVMVVIGLSFLIFGLNYLKGINIFTPTTHFYAKYAGIDGLTKSAPVLINGHKVGLVHDITYDFTTETPFTVCISLDDEIRIPSGSTVELIDDGLIGSKCAQIVLNKNADGFCSPGDTLASAMASGLFDDLQAQMLPQLTDSIFPHVDSLLIACRILISSQALENSLKSLEVMTKNLELSSEKLKTLMNRDLPGIVANVDTITANFATTSKSLSTVDIAATVGHIDQTVSSLKDVSDKLNSTSGTIGLLLNDDSLYNNLNGTVTSADELLKDLKAHPKRYINVSVFGGKTKDQSKQKQ